MAAITLCWHRLYIRITYTPLCWWYIRNMHHYVINVKVVSSHLAISVYITYVCNASYIYIIYI